MDGLFIQLAGSSSHLLFAPDVGIWAYPTDHPYADYSRSSISAANGSFTEEGGRLQGKGCVAELREGDAIFVPNHWWRQVHWRQSPPSRAVSRSASEDACCISLGLHFHNADALKLASQGSHLVGTQGGGTSHGASRRLPAHVHAQLARAAEELLRSASPSVRPDGLFNSCAQLLDGSR